MVKSFLKVNNISNFLFQFENAENREKVKNKHKSMDQVRKLKEAQDSCKVIATGRHKLLPSKL